MQVSDADIGDLAQHLKLRTLYLDGCIGLTTASLSSLLEHSHSTLTALSVVGTFVRLPDQTSVTTSICALLTACKSLTMLGLNSHNMLDGYMYSVAKLCVRNPSMTADDLHVIASNCVSLQCLYLDENVRSANIDSVAIGTLFDKCAKLNTLVVKGEVMYGLMKRAVAKLSYRVPRIHVSCDVEDMKLDVLDLPVD